MQTHVSQKAVIFNNEGKFLTLFRTETAPAHPRTWDFPGGELKIGEDPISGIRREVREETGLEIQDIRPFDVEAHADDDGEFWVTIAYKAIVAEGEVKLSFEHDSFQWVTPEAFFKLQSQPKLHRFAQNLQHL